MQNRDGQQHGWQDFRKIRLLEKKLRDSREKEGRLSNVIEFKQPKKPKEPRKLSPALRKALIWAGVVVALVAIWGWFYVTGG